jgi:hypothetical protein
MRLTAPLALLVLLAACSTEGRLHERKAYWEQALAVNVPTGTTRQEASRWLSSQGVTPLEDRRQQHVLSAKVEELPDKFSLVCSYWSITVNVFFDDADRSVRNQVDTLGTCL